LVSGASASRLRIGPPRAKLSGSNSRSDAPGASRGRSFTAHHLNRIDHVEPDAVEVDEPGLVLADPHDRLGREEAAEEIGRKLTKLRMCTRLPVPVAGRMRDTFARCRSL
jgi:hypothetical protein